MTYAVRVTFQEFARTGVRSGKCPICGKRGRRTNQFTATQNPWNKNPDGSVRTPREIGQVLDKQAREWSQKPFVHARCEKDGQS